MTAENDDERIGELLGTILALLERDLGENPDDMETIEKIRCISETFRNFSVGDLRCFKDDFERGYDIGKRDVRADSELEYPPQYALGRDFDKN